MLLLLLSIFTFAAEETRLTGVGPHFPLFRYVFDETETELVAFTKLNSNCTFVVTQQPPYMEWYERINSNLGRVLQTQNRRMWKARFQATRDKLYPGEFYTFTFFPKDLLGDFILGNRAQVFATKLGSQCHTLVTFRLTEKPGEILRLDSIRSWGETRGSSSPEKMALYGVNLSTGEEFEFIFPEEIRGRQH